MHVFRCGFAGSVGGRSRLNGEHSDEVTFGCTDYEASKSITGVIVRAWRVGQWVRRLKERTRSVT